MSETKAAMYIRLPVNLIERIQDAARDDDRSAASWVSAHFRNHFAEIDRLNCGSNCPNPAAHAEGAHDA